MSAPSVSFWRALQREQGDTRPKVLGGGRRSGRIKAQRGVILGLLEESRDMNIVEVRGALGERRLTFSYGSVKRFLQRHGITCKKDQPRCGAEPDAVGAQARAVTNAWRANRNRADAGHDLAFGQVAVAHQPSAAFFGARLGVAIKERGNLRLDRPRQQGPGATRSSDRETSMAGKASKRYCHSRGITPSLEKWRLDHPHDTPP